MRIVLVAIAFVSTLGAGCAFAGNSGAHHPAGLSASVDIRFTSDELRIIRHHYESQVGNNGRGKGKPKGLPPGIAKNLARGKPLPPGIAKQVLPYDLIRALPPVRDGYERIIVGGKILLVEIATQVVRDVLTDIVFGR